MVRLTKIHTRTGDEGTTALGDGSRVTKGALRIEVLGTIDEANAALGLARLHMEGEGDSMAALIQNDLFDLGADLCNPATGGLRITEAHVARLEREIDDMNGALTPLSSFVLPGGSPASAHLHLVRTVVRRAERLLARLAEAEPLNPEALKYLNRLSDHLFVLARTVNGERDVTWRPGENR